MAFFLPTFTSQEAAPGWTARGCLAPEEITTLIILIPNLSNFQLPELQSLSHLLGIVKHLHEVLLVLAALSRGTVPRPAPKLIPDLEKH